MKKVFEILEFDKKKSRNHIIFICDHASNNIPNEYMKLGLKKNILRTHIAWDIGVKEVSKSLARILQQSCFCSNFSRLLIDPNRNIKSDELILEDSFNIKIPRNYKITKKEKEYRLKKFFDPYHSNLRKLILKKKKIYKNVYLIAIHSFIKESCEFDRGPEFGLLWNKDIDFFLKIKNRMLEKNIHVANNYPYSGYFYNYTLDRHSRDGDNLKNISIEIRNDLICRPKGIKKCVKLLYNIFMDILDD